MGKLVCTDRFKGVSERVLHNFLLTPSPALFELKGSAFHQGWAILISYLKTFIFINGFDSIYTKTAKNCETKSQWKTTSQDIKNDQERVLSKQSILIFQM